MRRLLAAALVLLAFLAACDDVVEEGATTTPPAGTLTATDGATPTPPGDEGTIVPVTPLPSPSPVPDDWKTYADPEGRFTLRYPPDWFTHDGILATFKVGEVGPTFPPGSIKVDVSVAPVDTLSYCEPPGASPGTLSGIPGWQLAIGYDDPSKSNGVTLAREVGAVHEGYCVQIGASFAQEKPDNGTLSQIVDSFRFTDQLR